ncbi:M23 family metallopeptidase [Pseudomonas sp. CAN2814]|uniref:M23 family metallopeptidase n=1 Tax=Pseudomonas sp. CAN1 TaxID=3046726 RepID=UPI0026478039|nr:M23 family metallopeptidase [Pseudomonas sp. CAN1]MDN6859216.1 M23 family metallopeptidase [Pseudomonas sp. CAN1]
MIISPPFIPAPVAGETDEAFVERAMPGGNLGDGAFPLSFDLNWHGGLHLRAPQENGKNLPVRAIADGTLAYFRAPTAKSTEETHALNYRTDRSVGDGWTDNGCIVLRHETEIGEGARSQVVFYSIYMHLSKINIANPQLKQRIYRKDSIGEVGEIYGSAGKIHFEIIASDTQVEHLTGRSTGGLDYRTGDGRTDSCWGDMYFYVPSTLHGFAAPPTNFASPTTTGTAAFSFPTLPEGWLTPSGSPSGLAITTTQIDGYRPEMVKQMQQGLIVRMRYDRGQCQLTTYHLTGELIGSQNEDTDFEYNLYTTATRRYPACPSAGYELLRFGRILGPDALQPANAAHWRRISLPPRTETGEAERHAWFNLNAPGVTRFSDADFPHWMGWRLIDDDDDSDSHCQSEYIRTLLEPPSPYTNPPPRQPDAASIAISPAYDTMTAGDQRRLSEQYVLDHERNATRLSDAGNQEKLRRLICKFPTEWARDDFDTRYGWLKKVAADGPMSEDDFKELEEHHKALAFWEEANLADIETKHWHFPPYNFISIYRKCGWLSSPELAQCIPRHVVEQTTSEGQIVYPKSKINWATALSRADRFKIATNNIFRKYTISSSKLRMCYFLENSIQETTYLSRTAEGGGPSLSYAPWYGRGMMQLTWEKNYKLYTEFRTGHQTPTFRAELESSLVHASESAGFYWVSVAKGPNLAVCLNRFADTPPILIQQTLQNVCTDYNYTTKTCSVSLSSTKYYTCQQLETVARGVNTGNPNSTGTVNGLVPRRVVFASCLLTLTEMNFPDGNSNSMYPGIIIRQTP